MAEINEYVGIIAPLETDSRTDNRTNRHRCKHHPKKKIRFVCESCGGEKICKKCLKSTHKDHQTSDVSRSNKKHRQAGTKHSLNGLIEIIDDDSGKPVDVDRDENEDTALIDLQKKSQTTIEDIDAKVKQFAKVRRDLKLATNVEVEKVRARAFVLKQQVDELTMKLEKRLRDFRKSKDEIIKEHERSLKEYSKVLKDYCTKCKPTQTDSSSDSGLHIEKSFDIRQEMEQFLQKEHHIHIPVATMDEFVPFTTTLDHIMKVFGDMESQEKVDVINRNQNRIVPTCMDYTEISAFQFEGEVMRSICPTDEGSSWIVRETHNMVYTDIQHVTNDGEVGMSSVFDAGVLDIASNMADLSLVCCTDNTVRRLLPDGQTFVRFRTEARPESLCFQSNNDVVVCFFKKKKVAVYNLKGRQLLSSTDAKSEAVFITHPFRVRSNRKNNDIAVLNANPYSLVVMSKNLSLKFIYNGSTYYPEDIRDRGWPQVSTPNIPAVLPNDVCFDNRHNILLCDAVSKCIVTIDPNGVVMRAVCPDNNLPSSLALDINGYLWVGYHNGRVKIIEH
ncbi:uncharacterized protein LOC110452791 [Mizuhopecten yessoensis]|uniref:uncharacterized protein LOC110452791 n=1 Tax=Mizuhopecten yessoensis TaxID=6573 RepID=UPI000B45EDD1|nr:uncharacterized protein LOC110452791 [Mizuhopecten yessoensis]